MGEVASTYTTAAAGLIDGAINTRELQQKGRAQSLPKGEAGMQAVLHTMCRASRLTAPMGSLSQGLDALPLNPPHFGRDPHRAQLRRGVIYLVNFEGRHFNCFKLPLEKPEWSTINQADLAPRAHPLRAGNQLPPPDPLLMNFAGLLISCERTARPR